MLPFGFEKSLLRRPGTVQARNKGSRAFPTAARGRGHRTAMSLPSETLNTDAPRQTANRIGWCRGLSGGPRKSESASIRVDLRLSILCCDADQGVVVPDTAFAVLMPRK